MSSLQRFGLAITLISAVSIAFLFWDEFVGCSSAAAGGVGIIYAHHANSNGTSAGTVHATMKLGYDPYDDTIPLEGVKPRAFPVYAEPFPCVEPEKDWDKTSVLRSPATEGFLYVKEMKTGSSTVSGVALRIALQAARRQGSGHEICKARFDHTYAYQMFAKRDRTKSFLWTIIREPTSRASSQFFHFEVSRKKTEPTDVKFQDYLKNDITFDNHYFQTLSLVDYMGVENEANFTNNILEEYDFIGITERLNESLVVLSMLLKLELTDILYLSSKENGSFDYGGTDKCTYITPTYISPGMKEYFSKDEQWKMRTLGDHVLYRAAHRSLDMTIEKLGRGNVTIKVEEFNRLQAKVQEECLSSVTFPCDSGGRRNYANSCVWMDSGCGNQCIDSLVQRMT